jgi:hypothetical protein
VRFKILRAVTEDTVFWDVTQCSLVDNYECFGGTWWLHHQGIRLGNAGQNGMHTGLGLGPGPLAVFV